MTHCIKLLPVSRLDTELDNAFLVEEHWPAALPRHMLRAGHWLRSAAPASGLLTWLQQDDIRWNTFCEAYRNDLLHRPQCWQPLLRALQHGDIVLLHSCTGDGRHPAQILAQFLAEQFALAEPAPVPAAA